MITKEKVYIFLIITHREGTTSSIFPQVLDGRGLGGQTPLHRGVVKLVPRTNINTTRNKRGKRGGD